MPSGFGPSGPGRSSVQGCRETLLRRRGRDDGKAANRRSGAVGTIAVSRMDEASPSSTDPLRACDERSGLSGSMPLFNGMRSPCDRVALDRSHPARMSIVILGCAMSGRYKRLRRRALTANEPAQGFTSAVRPVAFTRSGGASSPYEVPPAPHLTDLDSTSSLTAVPVTVR